jgi:hypothetical protein
VSVCIAFRHVLAESVSGGEGGVDVEMKALEILPIDRENCQQNSDCDDWCKERGLSDSRKCVCRCEKWIPEADFSCKNGTTYCQVFDTNKSSR